VDVNVVVVVVDSFMWGLAGTRLGITSNAVAGRGAGIDHDHDHDYVHVHVGRVMPR